MRDADCNHGTPTKFPCPVCLQIENADLRAKLTAANTRIGTLETGYDILKGQTGKLKAKLTAAEKAMLYLLCEGIDDEWQVEYCPLPGDTADRTDQECIDAIMASMAEWWPDKAIDAFVSETTQ